jgi:uncharacterized protein
MRLTRIIVCVALLGLSLFSHAQELVKQSNPPKLVNDYADALSASEEAELERKLVAYDDSTSNQVAIVLIKTLEGYPIEEYALKLFRAWQIGNKKTNNGILILAAIDDRQVRIEVGYGLEGAIPDIVANQIIRNDIAPAFRSGNYSEGLDAAAASVIRAAAGEYKAPEGYGKRKGVGGGKSIGGLVILFVVIIIILSNINRGGGGGFMSRRGYRRGITPPIFWPGGWSGGGGGGWSGGGGGGFGGFGGGSSGGGGASGSW